MTRYPVKQAKPRHSFFPLVPQDPLTTSVPVVSQNDADQFHQTLESVTGQKHSQPTITTPEKQILNGNRSGSCGRTPGGSGLVYTPSKHLTVTVTTPQGKNREKIELCLLERKKYRVPKKPASLFDVLRKNSVNPNETLSVTANQRTKKNQPPRKTQKRERDVMRQSAKNIVLSFFENMNIPFSREIEKENWNLCHLLSYAIAMNAKTNTGAEFNTQIPENLFSGTRVLNENMMRIENVLLESIKENRIKEIQYMAIHSEFDNSHILAELTLKVRMITHDDRAIDFEYPFDVTDNRKLSTEFSTAVYALLKSIMDDTKNLEIQLSPMRSLF